MAVLIILGVLFVISSKREIDNRTDLTSILRKLLDEAAKNQEMRQKVVDYNISKQRTEAPNNQTLIDIEAFLGERINNPILDYSISICKSDSVCPIYEQFPVDSPSDIYAAERIITTTQNEQDSGDIKKIKIFMWRVVWGQDLNLRADL